MYGATHVNFTSVQSLSALHPHRQEALSELNDTFQPGKARAGLGVMGSGWGVVWGES